MEGEGKGVSLLPKEDGNTNHASFAHDAFKSEHVWRAKCSRRSFRRWLLFFSFSSVIEGFLTNLEPKDHCHLFSSREIYYISLNFGTVTVDTLFVFGVEFGSSQLISVSSRKLSPSLDYKKTYNGRRGGRKEA